MTLYQVIKRFEEIAQKQPNVRTVACGNIYDLLNNNPKVKYNAFIITQNTHQETEDYDKYGLTFFMVDRLTDDLEDNRLQIQSTSKSQLSKILNKFADTYGCILPDITYTPFTQKFVDECAGVYASFVLSIEKNECEEDDN